MWKRSEETVSNQQNPMPATPMREDINNSTPHFADSRMGMPQETKSSIAKIGESLQIKGELSGSEDRLIEGRVEGNIEIRDYQLTVGAGGNIKANINAKKVIIHGSVVGNIRATDGVDVRKSGSLVGDLIVAGVSIEERAYFKGSIDIQKVADPGKQSADIAKQTEQRKPPAPAVDANSDKPAVAQGAPVGAGPQRRN